MKLESALRRLAEALLVTNNQTIVKYLQSSHFIQLICDGITSSRTSYKSYALGLMNFETDIAYVTACYICYNYDIYY